MLNIDQAVEQLEQMLLDALTLALKIRKITVADTTTLRAATSSGQSATAQFSTGDLAYVNSKTNVYEWDQSSTASDDDDLVIKPTDAGATGRWLKAVTTVLLDGVNVATLPTGIVKVVILHNGDFDEDVLQARIYGLAPCVAIHFAGEQHAPLSQIPGALYDYRVKFDLWSVSQNFRDNEEGSIGSPIAAEVADDPGVMRIHGLVKKCVAGKTGEELGQSSVKYIELGAGELVEASLSERRFVMSLEANVLASIHNPDAPVELSQPTETDVQRNFSSAPIGSAFDPNNCVNGLSCATGLGFTYEIAGGSAVIAGASLSVLPTIKMFKPEQDTYRDLTPSGQWVFTTVPNGSPVGPPAAGNLRVGRTVTNATGVVADALLCSVSIPYPAPNTPDVDPL